MLKEILNLPKQNLDFRNLHRETKLEGLNSDLDDSVKQFVNKVTRNLEETSKIPNTRIVHQLSVQFHCH